VPKVTVVSKVGSRLRLLQRPRLEYVSKVSKCLKVKICVED